MRLKNKLTGEMGDLIIDKALLVVRTGTAWLHYSSLAELNEEWEDYEEPKEPKKYWYINEFGTPTKADFVGRETLYDKCRKNFGNYFETEEEAEQAVEKLKAWKRLKDKGFRFLGYYHRLTETKSKGEIGFEMDDYKGTKQDLDLLFCPEENI